MRSFLRSSRVLLIVVLTGALVVAACGSNAATEPKRSTPADESAAAGTDTVDDAVYVNGLMLAAANVGTPWEQVAVWLGKDAPKLGKPSDLDIDPPLGPQPRTSRDGDTLAWLAGTAAAPQLWVISGDEESKLIGLTGDDGALDVRSMDVSGDGASLVVSTRPERAGESDAIWRIDVASGGARRVDEPGGVVTAEYHDVSTNTDASIIALRKRVTSCDGDASTQDCTAGLAMLEVEQGSRAPVPVVFAEGQGAPRLDLRRPTFSQDDELLLFASGQPADQESGARPGVTVRSIPTRQLLDHDDDIEPVTVANGLGEVVGITMSPDGQQVAIAIQGMGAKRDRIETYGLAGGTPLAAGVVPSVGAPVWVPADTDDPSGMFAAGSPA